MKLQLPKKLIKVAAFAQFKQKQGFKLEPKAVSTLPENLLKRRNLKRRSFQ